MISAHQAKILSVILSNSIFISGVHFITTSAEVQNLVISNHHFVKLAQTFHSLFKRAIISFDKDQESIPEIISFKVCLI
jgi:hypothetical protein